MRILYIVKDSPDSALGHAADRAREMMAHWSRMGHSVTCLYPNQTSSRNLLEKVLGVLLSYHFRRTGIQFQKQIKDQIRSKNYNLILAEELSSAWIGLKSG